MDSPVHVRFDDDGEAVATVKDKSSTPAKRERFPTTRSLRHQRPASVPALVESRGEDGDGEEERHRDCGMKRPRPQEPDREGDGETGGEANGEDAPEQHCDARGYCGTGTWLRRGGSVGSPRPGLRDHLRPGHIVFDDDARGDSEKTAAEKICIPDYMWKLEGSEGDNGTEKPCPPAPKASRTASATKTPGKSSDTAAAASSSSHCGMPRSPPGTGT
ncbi:hypothetical protein Pelo_19650 [Pelomyxa schiedti]|nr:hypothetical protein Pelo_19650 [Pelomyxa schiedti]